MNIDSLGEGKVEMLFDNNLVKNPADLYKLKHSQLLGLEKTMETEEGEKPKKISLQEKSVQKILAGIEASREVPFERVLYAIGIRYVGETVAKKLVLHFKNMDAIMNASEEELIMADEIGDKIAESLISFFKEKKHVKMIEQLRDAGLKMEISESAQPKKLSSKLEGCSFVVSGTFANFSRDGIKDVIEQNGGKNQSGVSAKTNFLLAGDEAGHRGMVAGGVHHLVVAIDLLAQERDPLVAAQARPTLIDEPGGRLLPIDVPAGQGERAVPHVRLPRGSEM